MCAVVSAENLDQFPRADRAQSALVGLDLHQYGADVGDSADAKTLAHPIAYPECHLHTSKAF